MKKTYLKNLAFVTLAMACLAPLNAVSGELKTMTNSHSECGYWGDFALIMLDDYEARAEMGDTDPATGTKGMLGYDGTEEGSMGRIYYDQVLSAIEGKLGRDAIYNKGKAICLGYPEGSFDPNNF
ncbi:hypothetical protein [Arenicella xantha]|nr:hypothetical protein [Arenicella xantha]